MTDKINEKEITPNQQENTEAVVLSGQQEGIATESNVMKKKDVEAVSKKQVVGKVFVQIGLYAFLIVMALIVLFPFYWMLISSLKTVNEYNASVPTLWPQQFKWSNYAVAFDADGLNLGRLFLNTCIVGIVSTILSLIVTVLSAYAFARLEFKGKNIMFAAMLGTMMIPGELFTITNYVTVAA
ncbi:MAG: carbohydrate ABC transporter permease, partial [Clostridia bacterium]|nr:carbohydrate ABC transporter permease [Clostridia bacterium]